MSILPCRPGPVQPLVTAKKGEPPATTPLEGLAQPVDKDSPTDSLSGVRQVRCLVRV